MAVARGAARRHFCNDAEGLLDGVDEPQLQHLAALGGVSRQPPRALCGHGDDVRGLR
jgi:hypothetical protein